MSKSKTRGKAYNLYKQAFDLHAKLNQDAYEFVELTFDEFVTNTPGFDEDAKKPVQNIEVPLRHFNIPVEDEEDYEEFDSVTMAIKNVSMFKSFTEARKKYADGDEQASVKIPIRHKSKGLLLPKPIVDENEELVLPTVWIEGK